MAKNRARNEHANTRGRQDSFLSPAGFTGGPGCARELAPWGGACPGILFWLERVCVWLLLSAEGSKRSESCETRGRRAGDGELFEHLARSFIVERLDASLLPPAAPAAVAVYAVVRKHDI